MQLWTLQNKKTTKVTKTPRNSCMKIYAPLKENPFEKSIPRWGPLRKALWLDQLRGSYRRTSTAHRVLINMTRRTHKKSRIWTWANSTRMVRQQRTENQKTSIAIYHQTDNLLNEMTMKTIQGSKSVCLWRNLNWNEVYGCFSLTLQLWGIKSNEKLKWQFVVTRLLRLTTASRIWRHMSENYVMMG